MIFGHYQMKQHSVWRNVGSWFTNKMTDWALDKPHGFYLSSFRCVSAFVASQVVNYAGPYPYIDGLILQVTQRIGSIEVRHEAAQAGQSTYTLRRLIRLWMAAWVNFSVLPLRVATVLGLTMAAAGMVALVVVAWLWLNNVGPSYGFGWLMAALLVFSGTQLVLLGLIGEYIGRTFLTVNQRPQAVVREVLVSVREPRTAAVGDRLTEPCLHHEVHEDSRIPLSMSLSHLASLDHSRRNQDSRQRQDDVDEQRPGRLGGEERWGERGGTQRRCADREPGPMLEQRDEPPPPAASVTATRSVAGSAEHRGQAADAGRPVAGFVLQVAEQATRTNEQQQRYGNRLQHVRATRATSRR